ncbi:hypothetical protein R6Q57_016024 [Mikania cordata]
MLIHPCFFYPQITLLIDIVTMNDLLSESFVSDAREHPPRDMDVQMSSRLPRSNSDMGMESFNKQIQDIEKQVDKLSSLLKKLKDSNEESKSVTKASSMKAIRKHMEKDVDEVGKIARNIKAKIQVINKENLTNRQKLGCGPGTGVDRSRSNMTNALTKRFRDIMIDFQTLRRKIDDEYREVVERRIITGLVVFFVMQTINNLIETGNSEQIFQNAMKEMGRGQVVNTLEEIQERHDAVREIEKKLLELHQIYLDMAVLVEAQGDLLDNIESQVANAVDHVHIGADALTTAKRLKKGSRKCMMMAITLLIVIAIIIILSILKPWKKN